MKWATEFGINRATLRSIAHFVGSPLWWRETRGSAFGSTLGFMLSPASRARTISRNFVSAVMNARLNSRRRYATKKMAIFFLPSQGIRILNSMPLPLRGKELHFNPRTLPFCGIGRNPWLHLFFKDHEPALIRRIRENQWLICSDLNMGLFRGGNGVRLRRGSWPGARLPFARDSMPSSLRDSRPRRWRHPSRSVQVPPMHRFVVR
jgi:hypothetical protein